MADKIVDDYYLNIDLPKEKATSEKKKLKLVPKKKILIKNKDELENKDEIKKTRLKKIVSSNNTDETKEKVIEKKKVSKFKKIKPIEVKEEKKELKIPSPKNIVEKIESKQEVKDTKVETKNLENNERINTRFINKKKSKETWSQENDGFERKRNIFKKNFTKNSRSIDYEEKENVFIRSNKLNKKKKIEKDVESITQNLISKVWTKVEVWDIVTIKELSEKIWISFSKLIAEFMKNWMMVNINSKIDFESACIVSEVFWVELIRANTWWANINDLLTWNISNLLIEDDPTNLKPRPPIVSIMWHVDHWKTSLLDYIRHSKIAFWEAGWITQSIWAYQVEQNWQKITFLDTPWHEAFTIMRARWAKSTDIAVLVVAADEWVKPQTIESINHAKEAWIPIIVAINKMDKEWANPDNVKAWLSENWLISEDWWWDVPMVPVSAKTWFWIDDLLWVILLIAEMQNLKANPDRNAIATVIESHLDQKLWAVATVIINTWTINKWDSIVCKDSFWKVKLLKDYSLKSLKKAFPWDPTMIVWLNRVVEWWDILQTVNDIEIAKYQASEYAKVIESQKSNSLTWIDLIMSKIKSWSLKQLKIVVKADTNWSLEAIKWSLIKLSTDETNVVIIHSWVWNISESDILMCQWSEAILIWFRTNLLTTAKSLLESSKVEFINSEVIYHITEKIEKIITWMHDPKEIEIILWKARVAWIFYTSKEFMIVWLKLDKDSYIENNIKVRVIRWDKSAWKWEVKSLKLWVEEVKKIEWPNECWIKFVWNTLLEMWDMLELYKIEYK